MGGRSGTTTGGQTRPLQRCVSRLPAFSVLTGWAFAAVTGFAQDVPLPVAAPESLGSDRVEEALLIPELVPEDDWETVTPVDEPVALVMGSNGGPRGRWRIEPHLQVKGVYDDNIFIRAVDPIADYVISFAPGVAFGFWNSVEARERFLDYRRGLSVADRSEGSFVAFDYTAILLGFSQTPSLNTVNHDGRFDARWERGKFIVGANVQFAKTLQPDNDPGRLVILNSLSAALTARYQFSPRTTFGLGLYNVRNKPQGIVATDAYASTVEWRGETSVDYALTGRVSVGVGLAGGVLQVEPGFNQTFERILARASYYHSQKLEAELRAGVEFRQSVQPGDRTYPVFDFRARWTPVAGTRIGLNAFSNVNKSIFAPQLDFTLTGAALTFEHIMAGGFLFSLTGGYQVADYVGEVRTDHYVYFSPGISYPLGTWGTVGVNYEYQRNNSTRDQSRFVDNRVAVEMTLRY